MYMCCSIWVSADVCAHCCAYVCGLRFILAADGEEVIHLVTAVSKSPLVCTFFCASVAPVWVRVKKHARERVIITWKNMIYGREWGWKALGTATPVNPDKKNLDRSNLMPSIFEPRGCDMLSGSMVCLWGRLCICVSVCVPFILLFVLFLKHTLPIPWWSTATTSNPPSLVSAPTNNMTND